MQKMHNNSSYHLDLVKKHKDNNCTLSILFDVLAIHSNASCSNVCHGPHSKLSHGGACEAGEFCSDPLLKKRW